MSVLNDLFEQILHSEERVRERFSKLRTGEFYLCILCKFEDVNFVSQGFIQFE